MSTLEKQVDALMRLCTAEKESDQTQLREEIRKMLESRKQTRASADPEYLIRDLLLELGAPDHLVGHPYAIQAILLTVQDRTYIDNITFRLYPQLADMFDTNVARIERSIRHFIEVTWSRGSWEILNRYFGNIVKSGKGKPTNGEFIARMANVVKQKMREAA